LEATRIRLFTTTGARLPDVVLPISKTEASVRLLRRIAKSEDSGFTGRLADLDAGRLEFSLLRKLFSRPELEKAIRTRLQDVNLTKDEHDQLVALLEQPAYWRAAQGGPDAARNNRFNVGRYAEGDPESKGKIRKSIERRDLAKSIAFASVVDAAKSAGWRLAFAAGRWTLPASSASQRRGAGDRYRRGLGAAGSRRRPHRGRLRAQRAGLSKQTSRARRLLPPRRLAGPPVGPPDAHARTFPSGTGNAEGSPAHSKYGHRMGECENPLPPPEHHARVGS